MIIQALALFTVFTAEPPTVAPTLVSMVCTKSGQQTSGLTKVCYYNCAGWEGAMTAKTYEPCPVRTLRWRLNRTGSFGPNVVPH
jgi:hypothetical protein